MVNNKYVHDNVSAVHHRREQQRRSKRKQRNIDLVKSQNAAAAYMKQYRQRNMEYRLKENARRVEVYHRKVYIVRDKAARRAAEVKGKLLARKLVSR